MSTEIISSDNFDPSLPPVEARPGRRPRTSTRATALAAAATLVLVGGVSTAAVRAFSHGSQPAALVPGVAFGFAQVDLDLPDGQASALRKLLAHFPDAPKARSGQSLRDAVLGAMLKGSSDPHIDYQHDVRPWLGNRAAIAGWVDRAGAPEMEIVLRSTDDSAARKHLHGLTKDGGLVFSQGYAVLARTQSLAEEAVASAHTSSLADRPAFRSDLAALPGNPAVSGWIDAAAAVKAFRSALGREDFDQLSMFGLGGLQPQVKGRVAVGVRVTDSYAEIDERAVGGTPTKNTPSSLLMKLPDGTIGAVELGHPGELVTRVVKLVQGFLGVGQEAESFTSCAMATRRLIGPSNGPSSGPSSGQFTIDGSAPASGVCPPGSAHIVHRTPPNPLEQAKQLTGLTLPRDAQLLLGSGAVLAYGGLQIGGLPKIAVRSTPADLGAAKAVAERLTTTLGGHGIPGLVVDTAGSDLVIATNVDYAHEVAGGHNLGGQQRFRAAMGDVPDGVGMAGYVDLADVLPLVHSLPRDLSPLKAFGFWTTQAGDTQLAQLRLVIG